MRNLISLIFLIGIIGVIQGQNKRFVASYYSILDEDRDISTALMSTGLTLEQIAFANEISNARILEGRLWIDGAKSAFRYIDSFLPEEYKEYDIPVDPSEWELMSIYVKNLSEKKLSIVKGKLGEEKAVQDDIIMHNDWNLVQGDSTINGLPCKLAINKKYGYRTWYTTNIPISHGPEFLGGLPGLIVVVQIPEQERSLVLQSIKEESFDSDIFTLGNPKKTISYDQYVKQGYY